MRLNRQNRRPRKSSIAMTGCRHRSRPFRIRPTHQRGCPLGVAFVLFGLVTSYLFCAAGAVLMGIALKSWIGGMVNGE